MILGWLILVPLIGGLLAWLSGRLADTLARWVALLTAAIEMALGLWLWSQDGPTFSLAGHGVWIMQLQFEWLPQLGTSFHLALDGLSLLMVLLTGLIGLVAVGVAWNEVDKLPGPFFACLLWVLAGIVGVFLAIDLFVFYIFWEVMLVPMYFLVGIWGHERRIYAALKFFIYTQVGSLLLLVAMLVLFFAHGQATGNYTFDYPQLLGTRLPPNLGIWLMLGFFVAFAIKLPVFPLHNWLPDAHGEAPTAGSVLLAGLLLKTGAYGLIRFTIPLFPAEAAWFAPWAMGLGAVGIIYGAKLAFSQRDIKRLVAYTSVSHMGFVLLAVFAWTTMSLQGAVLQIICHAISTGALFALAGMLMHRLHTRDIRDMGGFWALAPKMGAVGLVFALASLGLPGLGNFVAEFLILFGSFEAGPLWTILATVGIVLATAYSLRLFQKIFHGPVSEGRRLRDLGRREMAIMVALIAIIIWLGLYPKPVLQTSRPVVEQEEPTALAQPAPLASPADTGLAARTRRGGE